MPIYEYACQKCGAEFEVHKPISMLDDLESCPSCGGQGRKLVSVFASTEIGKYNIRVPRKAAFRGPSPSS